MPKFSRDRGRPAVGPKVETRLPSPTLQQVDDFSARHNLSRAEALRQLISDGLMAEESSKGTEIEAGAIMAEEIPDGAIKSGNVVDDLSNGDPQAVEALILTALAQTTLNGMTSMGKEQARRFLDIYRKHAIDRVTEK